jgi:hypothetical protein
VVVQVQLTEHQMAWLELQILAAVAVGHAITLMQVAQVVRE